MYQFDTSREASRNVSDWQIRGEPARRSPACGGASTASATRRTLTAMSVRGPLATQARSVVDYALVRRAALADLAAGRVARREVCDAQPYLLRAARYHGQPTQEPCPVCRHALVHVTY